MALDQARVAPSHAKVLDLVARLRKEKCDIPLVLFTYYNPVFAYGREKFEKDAAQAGADVDDDLPFRVGAKLRHGRWGEGLLVGIQREGSDIIATVHFASVGRKRLSLEYAHLEEI